MDSFAEAALHDVGDRTASEQFQSLPNPALRAVAEHQGFRHELIEALGRPVVSGPVRRCQQSGGMRTYYYRAA
jgi:hypothetical protein